MTFEIDIGPRAYDVRIHDGQCTTGVVFEQIAGLGGDWVGQAGGGDLAGGDIRRVVRAAPDDEEMRPRGSCSPRRGIDFGLVQNRPHGGGADLVAETGEVASRIGDAMPASSPWPMIHAERAALADDLATLTEEQWAQPSLCPGWSVRDVLAHMTATAKMTPGRFVAKLAGSGFRFNVMAQKNIAAETAGTAAATLAEFRRVQASTSAPPGPVDTWLGETIVHGEDIRRPLGINHTYPADGLIRVADFYKNSNLLIGAKNRIAGLSLRATDLDYSTGTGPQVSGPMLSLLLAMTGRAAAVTDLVGDGAAMLRSRD